MIESVLEGIDPKDIVLEKKNKSAKIEYTIVSHDKNNIDILRKNIINYNPKYGDRNNHLKVSLDKDEARDVKQIIVNMGIPVNWMDMKNSVKNEKDLKRDLEK